jgi:thioredoxin reductase (NADPH)
MVKSTPSVLETRRDQMFPTLAAADIARLRRFGSVDTFKKGAPVLKAGEVAAGLCLILSGEIMVAPRGDSARAIVTHSAGQFMGELAQLSGRPSLVDATAVSDIEAIVIPPKRLRDLMVEEAELGELIMRALILRRVGLLQSGVGGPVIVGRADNRDVLRLEGFLARNGHPHQRLDPDTDDCAKTLLDRFQVARADLPIVLCPNGEMMRNPSESQLARCIGMVQATDPNKVFDVVIVGAGPAGLAAAVYAASEGLSVMVIDCRAFGGQAGASARIENYLGFPTGITGIALMARAYNQAQKFGAEMLIPDEVLSLDKGPNDGFVLRLASGSSVRARTVIVASGANYRRLALSNLSEFEGAGVHYWASPLEGRLCAGQDVALVGAGNSAGQAAVYLASQAGRVRLLVRGRSLDATMSHYLCERIAAQPNIEVHLETEVTAVEGCDGVLGRVRCLHRGSGEEAWHPVGHLFLMIGADPNTSWLTRDGIKQDDKGFVCADACPTDDRFPFETTRRGVFAIGDVRAGSIKRVAASVGEGAQVVAALHAFLAKAAG